MSGSLNPLLFFPSEFLNDAFQTRNVENTRSLVDAKPVAYVGLLCFFLCAAPQGAPNFIVDLCEERMMPDGSVSKSPDLSSGGLSRGDHGENHRHIGAIWDTVHRWDTEKTTPRFFAVDSDGFCLHFEHRKLRELELEDHFPQTFDRFGNGLGYPLVN